METGFLKGRHAFVTGGGSGIGQAIARALAAEGASVTIAGRREDRLKDAASITPRLYPAVLDVTDEAAVAWVVAEAVEARGPVAIAVANAGIAEGRGLQSTTLDFWRRMMAVNLDGAFLTIRECLRSMQGAEWGRVIAVSSIAGLKGLKGAPCYSASKHGMVGLIRALAEDHLGKPVTFNALCPGYVDTDIIDANIRRIRDRAGLSEAEARAVMVGANRHGRLVTPEEVAEAALWLCGPHSDSINGQAVEICGGQL